MVPNHFDIHFLPNIQAPNKEEPLQGILFYVSGLHLTKILALRPPLLAHTLLLIGCLLNSPYLETDNSANTNCSKLMYLT